LATLEQNKKLPSPSLLRCSKKEEEGDGNFTAKQKKNDGNITIVTFCARIKKKKKKGSGLCYNK
jgi:hypothetical protein